MLMGHNIRILKKNSNSKAWYADQMAMRNQSKKPILEYKK